MEYPFMVEAENKVNYKETMEVLGNLNSGVDMELFVKVPFLKHNLEESGKVLTIHPYLLFSILVEDECYNSFPGSLLGYTINNETKSFHPLVIFVTDELFEYISINKTVNNFSFIDLARDKKYDIDGDYEKTIMAYLKNFKDTKYDDFLRRTGSKLKFAKPTGELLKKLIDNNSMIFY